MEIGNNQNRQYQDSVFVHLFTTHKKELLSICKALDSSITSDEIELISLENTLYTGLKNDISCVVGNKLIFLVEHQSTVNQNMPLRFLEYIGRILERFLDAKDRYARLLIKIPEPRFYVFYTGDENLPLIEEHFLSKAFIQTTKTPQIELIVKVINLNSKDAKKLFKSCPELREYIQFVRIVKEYLKKYGKNGYNKAIRYCIQHDILKDYIKENAKEIEGMLVAEYDYDMDIIVQREESYNAGRAEGIATGIERGIYAKAIETAKALIEMGMSTQNISKATGLSQEEIAKL